MAFALPFLLVAGKMVSWGVSMLDSVIHLFGVPFVVLKVRR